MEERAMSRTLDCLVSYFGLVDGEDGVPLRYFAYQIVAGPGPAEKWGVAIIRTLAVYDERERCTSCQTFHVVKEGGTVAAILKALRYLDAYHEGDHLRKVPSAIRWL